jgi:Heterokaryon incompatibility protein (HET)
MFGFAMENQVVLDVAPAFATFGLAMRDTLEDTIDELDVFGTEARPSALLPSKPSLEKAHIEIPSSYFDYHWKPLDSEKPENARLVTIERCTEVSSGSQSFPCHLLPSKAKISRPECRIRSINLDDPPEYEAISYTWLDFKPNIPLVVDGDKILHVNASLYACLQYLLEARKKLVLWWDQICIDQTNKVEKNEQVQLMKKIFEKAQKTYIWLGESNDDTDFALAVLREIVPLESSTKPDTANSDSSGRAEQLVAGGFRNPDSVATRRRNAVARLLNRPWFERAWIYQEAAVSKEAVVLIGRHELDFNQLCMAVEAFCNAEQKQVRNMQMSLANSMARVAWGYTTLRNIRQGREEFGKGRITISKSLQTILCRMAGTVTATVPQDMVYAFLAFQDRAKGTNPIKVDYELSVSEAYNEAAASLIRQTKTLDLFGIIGGTTSFEKLASWAPDWTQLLPQGRPIYQSGVLSPFNASKGIPFCGQPGPPPDLYAFRVQGKEIDEVSWIARHEFRLEDRNKGGIERFLQLQKHLDFLNTASSKAEMRPDARRELLRVLLADGAYTHSSDKLSARAVEHECFTEAQLNELLQAYDNDSAIRAARDGPGSTLFLSHVSNLRSAHQVLRDKSLICFRKKVFYTKHGSLGLAPQSVEVGDLLCVLHGSQVPIVLRKVEIGGPRFRVIGQCYLEGAMRGEKVRWTSGMGDDYVLI